MTAKPFKRRNAVVLATLAAAMTLMWHAPAAQSIFTDVEGFATKTGFRGVFAWQASQPVKAAVSYGLSPDNLDSEVITVPGTPDSAGMAIADGLEIGKTYYWQVEDLLTGEKSEVSSFTANNAYNDWNGSTYTLDMLVQLDSESLPKDIPFDQAAEDLAAGVNIFAERLYDAMDGFARLGKVIITDTQTDYAGSVPFAPTEGCNAVPGAGGNLADVLVQTTVPFDSHTFGGWAINDPCTSFYVGRVGWLVVPWEDDLMFGFTAVHEMMHYAFAAPDLYPEVSDADCNEPSWDGSLMHNTGGWNGKRWELTELDRNPELTPCDHGTKPYTWETLRERYTNVPERANGPIEHIVDKQARGNEDGGALDITILDRSGPQSSLSGFTPDDTNPPVVPEPDCSDPSGPVVTDPKEDLVNASPPESSLDVREGRLGWNDSSKELTFEIKVEDLGATNPLTAPEIAFNFNFTFGEEHLYVEATRDSTGGETFVFGSFLGSPGVNPRIHLEDLSGAFDAQREVVQIVLPSSVLDVIDVAPFKAGDRLTAMDIVARRGKDAFFTTGGLAADFTDGSCDFVLGTGTSPTPPPPPPPPPPPLPPPDGELSASSRKFEWQGSRSTNLEREPILGAEVFGCEGFDGPGCEERYVLLGASTVGGKVTVAIEGENPNLNDFDLFVYGPDRKEVASSGEIDTDPGIERVTFEVKKAGVYTLSVHAWLTADAAYVGVAELEPPAQASGGQSPTSSGASPSPDPEKRSPKRSRPANPPSVEEAQASPPPSEPPAVGSGPSEAPSVSAPPLASPEIRTKGVSATASLAAGVAALLTGLSAGFAIAKRR